MFKNGIHFGKYLVVVDLDDKKGIDAGGGHIYFTTFVLDLELKIFFSHFSPGVSYILALFAKSVQSSL